MRELIPEMAPRKRLQKYVDDLKSVCLIFFSCFVTFVFQCCLMQAASGAGAGAGAPAQATPTPAAATGFSIVQLAKNTAEFAEVEEKFKASLSNHISCCMLSVLSLCVFFSLCVLLFSVFFLVLSVSLCVYSLYCVFCGFWQTRKTASRNTCVRSRFA